MIAISAAASTSCSDTTSFVAGSDTVSSSNSTTGSAVSSDAGSDAGARGVSFAGGGASVRSGDAPKAATASATPAPADTPSDAAWSFEVRRRNMSAAFLMNLVVLGGGGPACPGCDASASALTSGCCCSATPDSSSPSEATVCSSVCEVRGRSSDSIAPSSVAGWLISFAPRPGAPRIVPPTLILQFT